MNVGNILKLARGAYRVLAEQAPFLEGLSAVVALGGAGIALVLWLGGGDGEPIKGSDSKVAPTGGAINAGGLVPAGLIVDGSRLLAKAAQNESKRELAELNETEDPATALLYYKEILANAPNDIAALIAAGDLMRRSGDLEGARKMFDDLHNVAIMEDRYGARARAMIGLGDIAVAEEKYTLARSLFDGAVKWSQSAGIYSMMAMALSRLGALELDTAERGYGDTKEAIHNLEQAAKAHRQLGDLDRLAEDELLLGRARESAGDVTGAWSDLTRARDRLVALKRAAPLVEARAAIYDFAMRHDRLPDAITEAAALVDTMLAAKDPDGGLNALAKLARAYEAAGDSIGACDALGRAMIIIKGREAAVSPANDRAAPIETVAAIEGSHRRLACEESESAPLP